MGACYTVVLKIRCRDELGAIKVLNEHILNDKRTDYGLKSFAKQDITTDNFDDLMRIFLAKRRKEPDFITKEADGFITYQNDFDASYSWEIVMMEMFKILAPFLEDNSMFLIYLDNDYDKFVVKDGKCVQLH